MEPSVDISRLDNKSKKKQREGITTSKMILIVCWSITIVLIMATIGVTIFTDKNTENLVNLTGVVTACASADTAFYSWKAKAENKIKLTLSLVDALAKQYGIEPVTRLAETLLSDK